MNRNRKYPWRESTLALPAGQWIQRGAIKVFEAAQTEFEFIDAEPWAPIKLCAVCDTAHPRTEPCPTCRAWAERDAELWSWERQRFANRHVIWTILDARKSVAA